MLNTVDTLIIILYFLAMIAIGFYSVKFAKTEEDFLVAGRRLSFPMFFGCMAAMAVGGGSTIGSTKLAYKFGISGIWYDGSLGIGLILLGILVSSKLSKLKVLSINEVIGDNYGKTARGYGALLTLIYTLMLSVVQVISMGVILSGVMGWSTNFSMLFGGGIVILYTFIGGMWSVSMTDIVQFVIKTIGVLLLAPIFALHSVGGWGNVVSQLPQTHFNMTAIGWDGIIMYVLMFVPGLVIGQDIWQRVFTAKNNKVARTGSIAAGIYSILFGVATIVLGLCVLVKFPGLNNPQDAFVTGVTNFLPTGIKGFVLAAAMAATMSVASGTILACSTVIYNDIYLGFMNKKKDEKSVWINRGIALAVGLIIMLFAFLIKDVLNALDIAYAYLSGCVFIPVLAAFVLKKFSPKAGLASLAASSIVLTAMFFKFGISSNYPIIIGMAVGLVVYVLVNLIDKNKVSSTVDIQDKSNTTA